MIHAFLASKEVILSSTFNPNLVLLFLKPSFNRVLKPVASDLMNSQIWSNDSRMIFLLTSVFYSHLEKEMAFIHWLSHLFFYLCNKCLLALCCVTLYKVP